MQNKIYVKRSDKIVDFLLGFAMTPLITVLLPIVIVKVAEKLHYFGAIYHNESYVIGNALFYMVALIIFSIVALRIGTGRKFIGIGIFAAFALTVLIPWAIVSFFLIVLLSGNFWLF